MFLVIHRLFFEIDMRWWPITESCRCSKRTGLAIPSYLYEVVQQLQSAKTLCDQYTNFMKCRVSNDCNYVPFLLVIWGIDRSILLCFCLILVPPLFGEDQPPFRTMVRNSRTGTAGRTAGTKADDGGFLGGLWRGLKMEVRNVLGFLQRKSSPQKWLVRSFKLLWVRIYNHCHRKMPYY